MDTSRNGSIEAHHINLEGFDAIFARLIWVHVLLGYTPGFFLTHTEWQTFLVFNLHLYWQIWFLKYIAGSVGRVVLPFKKHILGIDVLEWATVSQLYDMVM